MAAIIIDGKSVSRKIREECRHRVTRLQTAFGVTQGLAVIIVGENPASQVYVRNKVRAAEDVGLLSRQFAFNADVAPVEVLTLIDTLNTDPEIHGILVQLPLPPQFDIYSVLHRISPDKDVDGFHLYNVGGLVVGDTIFPPCTPYGVMKLLEFEGIEVAGKNVVIVGASNIVGKPMALMMMRNDATVAVCHAKTRDLAQFTIMADILVVAAGVPGLIVSQMVRQGAIVIDVGVNRLPSGKIVGDVDFDGVRERASYITPVPGGVGPMTVTMLISNTVASAERSSLAAIGDDNQANKHLAAVKQSAQGSVARL
jgi:methylenetetrahydrofolate dehydrogenase (NADP+)/methenyltetrahydrofolate cyclohydrolase